MSETSFRINNPQVVQETVDGEVVIIHLDKGYYYSLLKTGAEIWGDIEQGQNEVDIIDRLHDQYEGDRDRIEQLVHQFLVELQHEELIVPVANIASMPGIQDSPRSAPPIERETPTFEPPKLEKFTDMEDLLLLDPIHDVDVDEKGWPRIKAET